MKVERVEAQFPARATYHDSCSGLRELGIRNEPRKLLATVEGVSLREMTDAEVCCGFGGTFCVKYPGISDKMLEKKLRHIEATGADTLLAGDLGCLMNMAGKLKRVGSPIKVRHVAEVLAGDYETPPIAEAE
jgi:L-lactate dehydrogenase complex protein LldE